MILLGMEACTEQLGSSHRALHTGGDPAQLDETRSAGLNEKQIMARHHKTTLLAAVPSSHSFGPPLQCQVQRRARPSHQKREHPKGPTSFAKTVGERLTFACAPHDHPRAKSVKVLGWIEELVSFQTSLQLDPNLQMAALACAG